MLPVYCVLELRRVALSKSTKAVPIFASARSHVRAPRGQSHQAFLVSLMHQRRCTKRQFVVTRSAHQAEVPVESLGIWDT